MERLICALDFIVQLLTFVSITKLYACFLYSPTRTKVRPLLIGKIWTLNKNDDDDDDDDCTYINSAVYCLPDG